MLGVILDMDGTLLDTQRIIIPSWEYAGRKQGVVGVGEHLRYVCGMNEIGWSAYLEEHFPSLDLPRFKADNRSYVKENLEVRFMPGAERLLDFLDSHGVKYAIASGSSHQSIEHHLNEVGALERFKTIVGGKDVENGKPAPDIFLLAAKKMGIAPKNCFVFEDSGNGVRAGYAAGMRVFGISNVAPFDEDVKKLMYKELGALDEAIDFLKEYL